VLWFVAVDGVAGAAVVDNIRACPMWGCLFWFVQWRGDNWRDLHADFERRRVGALVLWFIAIAIVCVVVVNVDMRGTSELGVCKSVSATSLIHNCCKFVDRPGCKRRLMRSQMLT
jgi:hypothetical protein